MRYYPLMVNFDRTNGNSCKSCNNLDDASGRICAPKKLKLNLTVVNMITRVNETKTLILVHVLVKMVNT